MTSSSKAPADPAGSGPLAVRYDDVSTAGAAARRSRAGARATSADAPSVALESDPCEDEDESVEQLRASDEPARIELQERLAAYLRRGRPRVVVTDNIHTMVSIKKADDVFTFRLHHMFLSAPPAVLRALGRYAEGQERRAAKVLRTYIEANDHKVRRRTTPRPITVDVQGKYHNLQEIFDDLNERYFQGTIRARITWGLRQRRRRSRDSIKLGSYTFEDELIRIHPVLDAADVPRFFVEWIVYHEMLHEIHDMPVVDGRRIHHTPEFRRAEAEFERYAEAVLWERTHLHKLLDR